MKARGFFRHVHHDRLVEYCYSYKERVTYIRTYKPINEQELRLRLFKPVQGKLPAFLIKAGDVYRKAGDARNKARDAYEKVGDVYEKVRGAYEKAENTYEKALTKAMPTLLKLHAKECKNCPWDGKTILS